MWMSLLASTQSSETHNTCCALGMMMRWQWMLTHRRPLHPRHSCCSRQRMALYRASASYRQWKEQGAHSQCALPLAHAWKEVAAHLILVLATTADDAKRVHAGVWKDFDDLYIAVYVGEHSTVGLHYSSCQILHQAQLHGKESDTRTIHCNAYGAPEMQQGVVGNILRWICTAVWCGLATTEVVCCMHISC